MSIYADILMLRKEFELYKRSVNPTTDSIPELMSKIKTLELIPVYLENIMKRLDSIENKINTPIYIEKESTNYSGKIQNGKSSKIMEDEEIMYIPDIETSNSSVRIKQSEKKINDDVSTNLDTMRRVLNG